MSALRAFVLSVVVALTGVTGFAALSSQYADWGSTAVKWLMTGDEQRAWRNVKSDEQAQAFIDRFWARRDPTGDAPENNFRSDFQTREHHADEAFTTRRTRGSLTDQGRVVVILGLPRNLVEQAGEPASIIHSNAAHDLAAKTVFVYDRPNELGLTGPVVFVQNPTTGEYMLDPQQSNVMGALANAVKRAIGKPKP